MTEQTKYPFKFLDAYAREDRDIFFGRDEEVEALYQMVFQTDLILVYGASGTGKTSLIQCGLAAKFQPYEWLALSIRRGDNLNESLEKALAAYDDPETLPPAGDSLDWLTDTGDAPAPAPISPAARQLKNLYLRHFKPVFLIFDQFEELYILGSKAEQNRFVDTVREILRIEQPVKVLLSIREEYLGYLYEFERKVPELLRKKLRIEPMNIEKVQTVVQGISRLPYSNVHLQKGAEAAIGEGIFEKLKERENVLTIELPYLQVFLDKLYLQITGDRSRQATAEITLDELRKMGDIGDVLRNFLDDQVQENARTLNVPIETVKKLLAPFVTLDGTKEPLSADQLHARLPELESAFITRSLQAFQNSRILRYDEKEQRYEVAHDSLARQIATYQDAEDIALQKATQMLRTQMLLETDRREVFSEKQLLFMEPYLPKIELAGEEQAWLEHSRAYWEEEKLRIQQEKEAQLAEAQRQAEQERALRAESEKQRAIAQENAARARTRTRLALLALVVAVALALVAGWSYVQAEQQKELAETKTKETAAALKKVEQEKAATEAQRGIAEAQRSIAETKTREAEANLQLADENLKKAQAEEARARAALAQVEQERAATEEQRKAAQKNYELAQEKTREAEKNAEEARAAYKKQQAALEDVVLLILQNADRDILNLRYEDALEKIKGAASLEALKPAVAKHYLEIAFWHGETGNLARAAQLLDTIASYTQNAAVAAGIRSFPADTAAARNRLRDAMKMVDAQHFDSLYTKKYYPDMVTIPGGKFMMGCDQSKDPDCYDNETPHEQEVRSFQIARTETTVWQFALYCAAENRDISEFLESSWSDPGDNPAVNVSWYDAAEYANWVGRQKGEKESIYKNADGEYSMNMQTGYRLPTEAEWEYAAGAGADWKFAGCNTTEELGDYAWYGENSGGRTRGVGLKKPNPFGLYDMSGNVWEWCWDWFGDYPVNPAKDYAGPGEGSIRVFRGGSWFNGALYCRASFRNFSSPACRNYAIGFRLASAPQ